MLQRLVKLMLAILISGTPIAAVARTIVGIGIAKSDDHVYTWFEDGTFTIGTSSDLEKYRHAYQYFLPDNKTPADIVAMSIAGDDHVYTWYSDQTVSEGTSGELAKYHGRASVTLPQGKTMANIVGIGIAGSNDYVYVWYNDQTVSVGTSRNFFAHEAPHPYQLPGDPLLPGTNLSVANIVEMDIAKNDHVYTWYRNGMHSEGSSGNLARYNMGPYIKSHVLYHWWGPVMIKIQGSPSKPGSIGNPAKPGLPGPGKLNGMDSAQKPAGWGNPVKPGLPHPLSMDDPGQTNIRMSASRRALKSPPGPIKPFDGMGGPAPHVPVSGPVSVLFPGGDLDPMVAVSDKFMVVTGAFTLMFADRQGNPLPGMPAGAITTASFFSAFTDPSPGNEINLDRNVGFPGSCTGPGIPPTIEGHALGAALVGYCVSDFYDTRAYFDAQSKRFFIVVHASNNIQVNFTGWNGGPPGSCGYYRKVSDHSKVPLFNQDCLWSRFLFAIAVSKTDDPRDGFHQYAHAPRSSSLASRRNRRESPA